MSRSTSSRSTRTITPSTMSPSLNSLMVPSMAARKSSALPTALMATCAGPEGLRESEARLLGEVAGRRVLEVGCGAAQCSRWLRSQGAEPVAMDLSSGQLRQARRLAGTTGVGVPLVQADAQRLPFADAS